MGNNKTISIIGGGWRTDCWIKIIKKIKNVTLKDVFCRNKERAKSIFDSYNIVVESDYNKIYKEKPSLVIVCTAKYDNFDISYELIKNGVNVLCETPLEIPKTFHEKINKDRYGKLRVAEQYMFQPRFQIAKNIINMGILGNVHTVELSCCHDYHAMSLIRFILDLPNIMPDKIHTFSLKDNYMGTRFRFGEIEHKINANKRTISIMKFNKKIAIYDFTDGQYFSDIRSHHIRIKGERGEYINGKGYYINKNGKYCMINCDDKYSGTQGDLFNLDYIGTYFNGEEIYHNKYCGKSMSGEQIAMAQSLEHMFEFLETGKDFYSLENSDFDVKITNLMKSNIIEI